MKRDKKVKRVLAKLSRFTEEELFILSDIISTKLREFRYPPITKLELFLTEDCNLRCDYCFLKGKRPQYMSWDIAKRSVEFLFAESRDARDLTIIFFGGEPLLLWDVIKKVVLYAERLARKYGKTIHYSLTTNGILLSKNILRFSRTHGIMHLLSIDGDRETHDRHRHFPDGSGTFDVVASKIPLLKKYQGWLGARMTVTPETVNSLASNVRFLFSFGINQFIIGTD